MINRRGWFTGLIAVVATFFATKEGVTHPLLTAAPEWVKASGYQPGDYITIVDQDRVVQSVHYIDPDYVMHTWKGNDQDNYGGWRRLRHIWRVSRVYNPHKAGEWVDIKDWR